MNRIVSILFCYFCCVSSCTGQPSWLTKEQLITIFGAKKNPVPIYGIAEIRIPDGRVKHNAGDSWSFPIHFSDGSTKVLKLKRTDGLLANGDTPVWHAEGSENSEEINYTRHTDLKSFGRFDFYQDREEHAAFVVFHGENKTEGFIGTYRSEDSPDGLRDKYVFVPMPYSAHRHTSGIGTRVKRDTARKDNTKDEKPEIVYPQLLVTLERTEVEKSLLTTLKHMLAYWNAADMLYSNLEHPRIKLNIAGFTAPMNNFATPWETKARYKHTDKITNHIIAMEVIGKHFETYSHIFPEDQYDYMIGFVETEMDGGAGWAYVNNTCGNRSSRIALLMSYNLIAYDIGAHELGHLFSARDDEMTGGCQAYKGIMATGKTEHLEWSECSKKAFQDYFSKGENKCLRNSPQPKTYRYGCMRNPIKKCRHNGLAFTGHITCEPKGLQCTDFPDFGYFCSKSLEDPAAINICKFWKDLEPELKPNITYLSPEGVMCDQTESGKVSACCDGECIPIEEKIPQCVAPKH